MAHKVVQFTREEFYNLVWEKPATKLAAELGCSDVAIGKACRRHDVPKPYLGYWAKLEHGKNPEKTPLPSMTQSVAGDIVFYVQPARDEVGETRTTLDRPKPELDADVLHLLEKHEQLGKLQVAECHSTGTAHCGRDP